uniref:UBC core domain-containing protein n=1 Tax=Globodera rostochiensis TaxID=31243 RepID=A0A914IAI0_GLORO
MGSISNSGGGRSAHDDDREEFSPPTTEQLNMRCTGVKRLLKEAIELRHSNEMFCAKPMEDNLFEWHFSVRGPPDSAYASGVYHGRMVLPADYPMKPPNLILLTPNGRFETNKKICLSISGYHPETWLPSWSIRTALLALIGFMPTHSAGALGGLECSKEERRRLAIKSLDWRCETCGVLMRDALPSLGSTGHTERLMDEVRGASKSTTTTPPVGQSTKSTNAVPPVSGLVSSSSTKTAGTETNGGQLTLSSGKMSSNSTTTTTSSSSSTTTTNASPVVVRSSFTQQPLLTTTTTTAPSSAAGGTAPLSTTQKSPLPFCIAFLAVLLLALLTSSDRQQLCVGDRSMCARVRCTYKNREICLID